MAKGEDKPAKDKAKAKSKGKGGKAKKGKGAGSVSVSVAAHPRAAAAVKRAKGFGGVGGFLLAAYFSYGAGVPADQIGLRALAFGVAGYMLAWACSVTVWRHLVVAEVRAAVESGHVTIGSRVGDARVGRGSAAAAMAGQPGEDSAPADPADRDDDGAADDGN